MSLSQRATLYYFLSDRVFLYTCVYIYLRKFKKLCSKMTVQLFSTINSQ